MAKHTDQKQDAKHNTGALSEEKSPNKLIGWNTNPGATNGNIASPPHPAPYFQIFTLQVWIFRSNAGFYSVALSEYLINNAAAALPDARGKVGEKSPVYIKKILKYS